MKTLIVFLTFLPDIAFWSWKAFSRPISSHEQLQEIIDKTLKKKSRQALELPSISRDLIDIMQGDLAREMHESFFSSAQGHFYQELLSEPLPSYQLNIKLLGHNHAREFNMNVRGFKKALSKDWDAFEKEYIDNPAPFWNQDTPIITP